MSVVDTHPVVTAPPVNEPIDLIQLVPAPARPERLTAPSEVRRSPQPPRRGACVAAVAGFVLAVITSALAAWLSMAASTAGPLGPAAAPGYLKVTGVTPHSVSLRWNAPLTGAEVLGYEVIRDGVVADVLMPVQSTYNASGLAAGRSFTFQIRAVYAHSLSAPSTTVVATSR